MADREGWAGLLAEATAERAAQPQRICELCVEMLGVTGAGISMATASGNRGVVCATDEVSARIEDLQFTLGEGPCMDAVEAGTPVLVSDMQQPGDVEVKRWPAFMEGAGSTAARAVFAFPLRIGAIRVGALDLYRDAPGDLADDELSAALMAADAAALALLHLDAGRDKTFADDQDARTTYQMQVHQATGMVQIQLGVTTAEALLMLRARAFADGRVLAHLATDVVERRIRFAEEDP